MSHEGQETKQRGDGGIGVEKGSPAGEGGRTRLRTREGFGGTLGRSKEQTWQCLGRHLPVWYWLGSGPRSQDSSDPPSPSGTADSCIHCVQHWFLGIPRVGTCRIVTRCQIQRPSRSPALLGTCVELNPSVLPSLWRGTQAPWAPIYLPVKWGRSHLFVYFPERHWGLYPKAFCKS